MASTSAAVLSADADPQHQRESVLTTPINDAVDSLSARFGLHGAVKLQQGCAVKLQLKRKGKRGSCHSFPAEPLAEPTDLPTQEEAVKAASSRCELLVVADAISPAREACESTLSTSEFTVEGLDLDAIGMLEQVRKALAAEVSSIRAEMYKLSIMPAGARRSSTKRDLPDDPSCFGVLEVVLPGAFDGGSVTMTYQGVELKSDFEQRIATKPAKARPAPAPAPASPDKPSDEEETEQTGGADAEAAAAPQPGEAEAAEARAVRLREAAVRQLTLLEYSACFGDVKMSVGFATEGWQDYMPVGYGYGKVNHGTRFALVYTLHRDDAPSNALLGRASAVHKALRKGHYMEAALAKAETKFAASRGVVSEASACNLPFKGKDAVVGAVLAASGLKLECLRMASKYRSEQYVMDKMPTKKDDKNFGFQGFDGYTALGMLTMKCHEDQLERKTEGKVSSVIGDVTWLGSHKPLNKDWCKLYIVGRGFDSIQFTTSSAIIATVPPFATRTLSNVKLTIEHVRPFKVAKASKSAAKGKRKAQGGGPKKGGKRSKVEDSEDAWDSDQEERLKKELEADDDSDNASGEDNAPQASRGRGAKGGSRKAAVVAEVEEDEEAAAPASGSSGGGGVSQGALRRPPVLFQPDDPSMMTEAQKKEAGLHVERRIHVHGGKGKYEASHPDGKATIKLKPGDGLAQLKKKIKETFGKVRQQKVGPLVLADAHGNATSSNAATADLVDGASVIVTYTDALGSFF
ncbi:hypothetical protein FOA52_015403 [Chlamydomonas sp. UWO 241]|nr:hypothetical protein FOA52_015403 [Chlamydomonas sp. UWO 241]